jgi:hypothetical protein
MRKVPFHTEYEFNIINKRGMVFQRRIGLDIRTSFLATQNCRGFREEKIKRAITLGTRGLDHSPKIVDSVSIICNVKIE